ncbi:MAG: DUF6439 family protein, partial [Cyanobacteriota bacterium]|nr:DUF6439 family protein [Cyanobacteriota bacterium]
MLETTQTTQTVNLNELSTVELAQALAARLAIPEKDWHRL